MSDECNVLRAVAPDNMCNSVSQQWMSENPAKMKQSGKI